MSHHRLCAHHSMTIKEHFWHLIFYNTIVIISRKEKDVPYSVTWTHFMPPEVSLCKFERYVSIKSFSPFSQQKKKVGDRKIIVVIIIQ